MTLDTIPVKHLESPEQYFDEIEFTEIVDCVDDFSCADMVVEGLSCVSEDFSNSVGELT